MQAQPEMENQEETTNNRCNMTKMSTIIDHQPITEEDRILVCVIMFKNF